MIAQNETSLKLINIVKNMTLEEFVLSFGGRKRNVGAREAKYDIVLFLDSDCIATPNLLNEHYKMYTDDHVGAVAGLLEFVGEDTWFGNLLKNHPL